MSFMHLNLSAWFGGSDFNHIIKAKHILEILLNHSSERWNKMFICSVAPQASVKTPHRLYGQILYSIGRSGTQNLKWIIQGKTFSIFISAQSLHSFTELFYRPDLFLASQNIPGGLLKGLDQPWLLRLISDVNLL